MSEVRRNLSSKVLEFLQHNQDTIVTLETISGALREQERRVQLSMGYLRRGVLKDRLDVIVSGHAWVYRGIPAKPEAPETFEYVGQTKQGAYIVQGNNGALYRAEMLD